MNGHDANCMCAPCMVADMNSHLANMGATSALVAANSIPMDNYSERTRYATPGTRTGRGIVRKVSDKQLDFMLRLFRTRDTSKLVRLPGSENIESMSLAGARDLIDRLLSCPEIPAKAAIENLATEKQLSFIQSLISSKNVPADSQTWFDANKSLITKQAAKEMIERLLKLENKSVAKSENANIPNGRYALEIDGVIKFYRVRTSKSSGKQYVSALASDTEHYMGSAPKIVALIANDIEAAFALYGEKIGKCGICHRTLTDEESRARGIGPDCFAKL